MTDAFSATSPPVVWLNGQFLPLQQAALSPLDRGFLYGDGLFETLRAEAGCPLFLKDHLQRLACSLAALHITLPITPDWDLILSDLLQRNRLGDQSASLKIIISRGICSELGLPAPSHPTLCAIAQKYVPPAPANYQQGWHLQIFRHGYAPPLAQHKSLNYLYFLTARQAALDAGADEAVILDAAGKVSETSAGSLLFRSQGKWWTPANAHQLPGITLQRVSQLLADKGTAVAKHQTTPEDLYGAETIWVLNSLIGIIPVCKIMDTPIAAPDAAQASRLRTALFEQGRSV